MSILNNIQMTMSKAEVKKYIKSLERGSLEELVMDLYSARKEAKEYLEYVIKTL